jgi:cytochrome c oxidase subunit 3
VSEAPSEPYENAPARDSAAELGVWIFIATELMFFGPLFAAYLQNRLAFAEAFTAASRHTDFVAGTLNTFVLLTSSLCVALGLESIREAPRRATRWLSLAVGLGAVFLTIKGFEYAQEWREQLVPGPHFTFDAAHRDAAEIFFYLYFALTGVHALHLVVGIVLLSIVALRLPRGAPDQATFAEGIGRYWHFVDALWVFLYPMLYLVGRHG